MFLTGLIYRQLTLVSSHLAGKLCAASALGNNAILQFKR